MANQKNRIAQPKGMSDQDFAIIKETLINKNQNTMQKLISKFTSLSMPKKLAVAAGVAAVIFLIIKKFRK